MGADSARIHASDDARVTIYWRPGCLFCMRLRLILLLRRRRPRQVNIWRDQEAAAFVRSVAGGNATVPTVVIDGEALINPPPRRVLAALEGDSS